MLPFFNKKNDYFAKKTFTFYIPSPPARKTGYQEKEFDAVIEHIVDLGFELIDLKIESHSGDEKSGLWVLCILGAKTSEIYHKKIHFDYSQFSKQAAEDPHHHIPLDPDIVHD